MSLQAVTITDVRCMSHAELEIPPGLSLIWGDNGSGKTLDPGIHFPPGPGAIVSYPKH